MREVSVPTGFAAQRCRRPIVLIAAWLVVLQAFLAGVATAQAGAMLASSPADVICHGSGSADPADNTAPDAAKAWHLCCASCTAPAVAVPAVPAVVSNEPRSASRPSVLQRFIIVVSHGAIRAGPSQAPPTLA
jgi:hypothetical protein